MPESTGTLLEVFKIIAAIFAVIGGAWGFGKGFGTAISIGLKRAGELLAAPTENAIAASLSRHEEIKALDARVASLEKSEKETEAFKTENLKFQGEVRDMFSFLKDDIAKQFQGLYTTLLINPAAGTRIISAKDQPVKD